MPPSRTQRPRNEPGANPKPYICGLCGQGFTRRYTVYDTHFQSCVKRNGNPDELSWDSHPSCQPKGSLRPLGTSPPTKTYKLPQGAVTTAKPPSPGATQVERQQAVVWMGQDVYRDLLARDQSYFSGKLRIYEISKHVVAHVGHDGVLNQIKALFLGEVGEAKFKMLA
ncbi:MAG: hypothetical protein Q9184_000005 [Pyrenodesmia sp. 2 TL-2023]